MKKMNSENLKEEIKTAYGSIATNPRNNDGCCTDAGCCDSASTLTMTENYSGTLGYRKEADLGLGCGIPTEIARIKEGDTVIDLGPGAGNDAFIARQIVGDSGKVIGVDMTPEMVIKAQQNNLNLGYKNVEFFLGEIENMSDIPDSSVDVAISNCVMNLVQKKSKAFAEIFRILKPGGHFSIADIVHTGDLPDAIVEAAELYSGCIAGASEKGVYLGIIKSVGFKNIQIKKENKIQIPDEYLLQYLRSNELQKFHQSRIGIYSITVYAEKQEEGDCCITNKDGCCGSNARI